MNDLGFNGLCPLIAEHGVDMEFRWGSDPIFGIRNGAEKEDPLWLHMDRRRNHQPDVTIDSTTIIPPTLGVSGVNSYREEIVPRLHQIRNIKAAGHVPTIVNADLLTIEPIAARTIDSIQFQPDATARRVRRHLDVFSIPGNLTRVAIGATLTHGTFDHIIVRNGNDSPLAIMKSGTGPRRRRHIDLFPIHQLDGGIQVG